MAYIQGYVQPSGRDAYYQDLMEVLMEYMDEIGCFTRDQAYYMLPGNAVPTIDKALSKLVAKRLIYHYGKDEDKFVKNPYVGYNAEKVRALWPVLIHKNKAKLGKDDFYFMNTESYTDLTYFINGTLYDIVSLDETNKSILIAIDRIYANEQEKGAGIHKTIFIIKNEEFIKTLPEIAMPHMFAIIDESNINEPVKFRM